MIAAGFEPVEALMRSFLEEDATYSASLFAFRGSEPVVDLTVGAALQRHQLLPVFSSTKGAAAIVIAWLIDRDLLDLDAPVAAIWPEFAANGKAGVTVRQLLSHQAGLPGVDGGFTYADVFGHDSIAERLAAQAPLWQPGSGHSYHAFTIGVLADELVRRVTGLSLGELFTSLMTVDRGVDVHLGTPETLDHRVARLDQPTSEEFAAWVLPPGVLDPGSYRTASAPTDPEQLTVRGNDVDFRRAAAPAVSATATAQGLAAMYAALTNPFGGHDRLVSAGALERATALQVAGDDLGHGLHFRFAVLWQKPTPRLPWGSFRAFGHDGAGGSLAYHDPAFNLSVGYVVKRVPLPLGGVPRAIQLSRALSDCCGAAGGE